MARFDWKSGIGGPWTDPDNWTNGAVPTAADAAYIPAVRFSDPEVTTSISVGSITNAGGFLYFNSPSRCDIGGNVVNYDEIGFNSTTVNIGGTLSNIQLGNGTLAYVYVGGFGGPHATGPGYVTVGALRNTGFLSVGAPASKRSTLDVQSAASFGTAGTVTGKVEIQDYGLIKFAGTAQLTTIAANSYIRLEGAHAFVADAGLGLTSNSALQGLQTIDGSLQLDGGANVSVSGPLTVSKGANIDTYDYDSDDGTTRLSVGGALTNHGTLELEPGHARLTVGSIDNTDGLVRAISNGFRDIEIDVGGTASFGAAGVVKGDVELGSGARFVFAGSRQLTTIDSHATLRLDAPDAFIADAGIDAGSNSALKGLNEIDGKLQLYDGGRIDAAGRVTVDTGGSVDLGLSGYANGGTLTSRAGLINHGRVTEVTGALLSVGGGLANDGAMSFGVKGIVSEDLLHVAGKTNNNGAMIFRDDTEDFVGDVGGHGTLSIGLNTTLTFDGAVGSQQQFYLSQRDTIGLSHPSDFDGAIHKFGHEDAFLIHAFDANTTFNFVENAAGTGGILNVADGANGSAHIHMAGTYDNSDFALTSVQGGGVRIASTS